MKSPAPKKLLLIFFAFTASVSFAQTNISGTINTYTDVTIVGPCANKLTVSNASGFTSGNSVIIMQMQGATMDETNNPSFGTISGYNSSGLWEKAVIQTVVGNVITFTRNLLNTYAVSGKVQVISFPTYAGANVNGTLTGSTWNGTTGGVIALEVTGTLTLNADINADGIGFRGGSNTQVCPSACNWTTNFSNQFYAAGNFEGAYKGEGIVIVSPGKELGKGAQANGGGGGNDHNNGGGGAGNYGSGGLGGNNNEPGFFNCKGSNNYGSGGKSLNYASLLRIYPGGGGGAGHGNNGSFTNCNPGGFSGAGGNGGGIIIITASTIVGNGFSITANGSKGGDSFNDGAGGGGAGGTLLLNAGTYSGNLFLEVIGGNGGDTDNSVSNRCVGPGGGGGAGVILSNAALPVNVTSVLTGGIAGYITNSVNGCNNSHSTATDGAGPGAVLTGVSIPQSTTLPAAGCGLPVTFIHFSGRAIQQRVELKWATATEVDADYFSVERSFDQSTFTGIGRVQAAGNTSTRTDYSFTDLQPYRGMNYYRLRQVDVTGYEKLTPVIPVMPEFIQLVRNIYPNPVGKENTVRIAFTSPEKDHHLELYDASGRLIDSRIRRRQAATLMELQLPAMLPGVYMLRVESDGIIETHKLFVN